MSAFGKIDVFVDPLIVGYEWWKGLKVGILTKKYIEELVIEQRVVCPSGCVQIAPHHKL
jgi:hypothetical protein